MHITNIIDMNSLLIENKYHRFFNKEDPIDKLILEFAEKNELKIGFVQVKPDRWFHLKKYISSFVKH